MGREEITLDEALDRIQEDLLAASKYPYAKDSTVPLSAAFAYGLVLGSISKLRDEWKEKVK